MTAPEGPTDSPMGGAPAAPSFPSPGPTSYAPGPPPPPPGPMGYAPPPPPPARSRRTGLVIFGVLAVILVVILGGVYLFRDRLSSNVTELAVGDCFDEPVGEQTITDVQHQPCTSAHDGEVFALLTHPAGSTEAYPVVSGFDDYIQQNCIPAWEAYTARTWALDADFGLSYYHPTLTGWGNGDRGFTCYTTRVDGVKLNGSVRGIGASPVP